VQAGRTKYDGKAAAACLDTLVAEAAAGLKASGANRRSAKTLSRAQSRTTVPAMWVRSVSLEVAAATSVRARNVAWARATQPDSDPHWWRLQRVPGQVRIGRILLPTGPRRPARPRARRSILREGVLARGLAWTRCTVCRMAQTLGFAARSPPKERAANPWEFVIRCFNYWTT